MPIGSPGSKVYVGKRCATSEEQSSHRAVRASISPHLTPNTLTPGSRLGPYEIVALLGVGGMGEVYRATDTKLKRQVAIKVLPAALTADHDRLARLQREAELLASLNHPHIAAIYGLEDADGIKALVLELVEGPTLADRIAHGPIPLDEALTIAKQIAEALEAAHEQAIIHRDLKPANIKVREDGTVKVLDFGLAKAMDPVGAASADAAHSPTISLHATRAGVILGTAAYMSPEQARGKPVDKRTDIWAFGCVLYELLTGRQAFVGETVADTIATILNREPEWSALDGRTPVPVRRLLQRCLDKDPRQRLRDIGDARHELDHVLDDLRASRNSSNPAAYLSTAPSRPVLGRIAAGVLVVSTLLVAGGAYVSRQRDPASGLREPAVPLTDFNDSALAPSLSPDGRMLTFIRGGRFGASASLGQVYVKILPKGEPVQLTHDQLPKDQPVFSPDGSRIMYTAQSMGFKWDSWQVPVLGGSPRPFLLNASGLAWLDDQRLLYSEIMAGVHMGIVTSTESRTERRDIYLPPLEGGMAHRSALSPDRKSLLIVEMDGGGWLPCRLMPFDGSSTGRRVGPGDAQCTSAAWAPDGRWMYFSSNAGGGFHIWRQRYPDGAPEQISFGPTEQEGTAITADGKYVITSMGLQQGSVWIHDAQGDRQLTPEGFAMLPTMAPSGDRVFYLVRSSSERAYTSGELWSTNLGTGEKEQVLPGRVMGSYSLSHDAKQVVFTSIGVQGGDGVWIADLDRRTSPRRLTRGGEFRAFFGAPGEIIYMDQAQVRHLYRMKEDGSGIEMISPEPVTYLISVSPDGRWATAVLPQAADGGGTHVRLVSTRGEQSVPVCDEGCSLGFGPNRMQAPLLNWSMDGKSIFVGLQYFGVRTQRTVVLPYRSDDSPGQLWPRGLKTEASLTSNPGARIIADPNAFPTSSASTYLMWRNSTQSNLYRMRLPN